MRSWLVGVCIVTVVLTAAILVFFPLAPASPRECVCDCASRPKREETVLQRAERERFEKRVRLYGPPRKIVRILFFTIYSIYHHHMDRHHFFFAEAAARHPWVTTELWGVDMPGWNASLSLEDNIIQRYGNQTWDVINMWPRLAYNTNSELWRHLVVATRDHETWYKRRYWPQADIMLLTFAYEMLQFQDDLRPIVYSHSPTAVDPYTFYAPVTANRTIDVLVVGAIGCNPPVYPLRQRFSDLIQSGAISGVVHPHPGYHDVSTVEEAEAKGINPEWVRRQIQEYASVLQRAKIVIGDTSVFKYGLQKLAEIAAAGALLMTDVPREREPEFRQYVVEVDPRASDAELVALVRYWLDHEQERLQRAEYGQRVTVQQYTWDDNVDGLIAAWQAYKRGDFGLQFLHPFSVGCSAIGRLPSPPCAYDYSPWCSIPPKK